MGTDYPHLKGKARAAARAAAEGSFYIDRENMEQRRKDNEAPRARRPRPKRKRADVIGQLRGCGMSDWLVALLLISAWADGFFIAWAMCNQHKPGWRGYLDGRTLRLWHTEFR